MLVEPDTRTIPVSPQILSDFETGFFFFYRDFAKKKKKKKKKKQKIFKFFKYFEFFLKKSKNFESVLNLCNFIEKTT